MSDLSKPPTFDEARAAWAEYVNNGGAWADNAPYLRLPRKSETTELVPGHRDIAIEVPVFMYIEYSRDAETGAVYYGGAQVGWVRP